MSVIIGQREETIKTSVPDRVSRVPFIKQIPDNTRPEPQVAIVFAPGC